MQLSTLLRSLRPMLVGLPVVSLAALGLSVSLQVGCSNALTDDEDIGISEDAQTACTGYGYGTGYGYTRPCSRPGHGYGYRP